VRRFTSTSTGILLNKLRFEEFKEAILALLKIKKNELVWARMLRSLTASWGNIAIQYRLLFDQLTKEENLNFCFPPIKLDHIKT
jgi:hypothetical protein